MTDRKELYRSPNGDVWFLEQDPANGKAFVVHEPNTASGGQRSRLEIGAFLRSDAEGPEHQALLRLIGSLVDRPPQPIGSGSIAADDLNASNDE
jgi:hypothetical protein